MTATANQRLSPAQAATWLAAHPDALLLDARDAGHHAAGHVEGSVRLDGRNHERLLMREAKSRPVLIYCYHGNASQTWASMFIDFGFSTVADIVGGWTAMELFDEKHPGLPLGSATSASASASAPTRRSVPPALADWLRAEGFDATRPNQPGQHGNTPLMHAAWRGSVEAVNALLAFGVQLDCVNHDGNNALWLACVNGEPKLIGTLVAAGVPIDHANLVQATALMYGASSGKHVVVATLLDLGANVHLVSQDDFSALDMAASVECLQLLRAATRRKDPLATVH